MYLEKLSTDSNCLSTGKQGLFHSPGRSPSARTKKALGQEYLSYLPYFSPESSASIFAPSLPPSLCSSLSPSPPPLFFSFFPLILSFRNFSYRNSWLTTLLCVQVMGTEEGWRINLYIFWISISLAINSPTCACCPLLPCQLSVVPSLLF